MRWLLSLLVLGLWTAVNALSSSGDRLLVVLEDPAEKDVYSTFWSDLESESMLAVSSCYCNYYDLANQLWDCCIARGYDLSFSAVKNEELSLFEYGVRAYDHLMLLPTKAKGSHTPASAMYRKLSRNVIDPQSQDSDPLYHPRTSSSLSRRTATSSSHSPGRLPSLLLPARFSAS